MRILSVCNLFPPYVLGGNEVRLREILERLRSQHEVRVLTSAPPHDVHAPPEPWITRELVQAVPYPRPITDRRLYLARELVVSALNYATTLRIIEEFTPDVVYVSDTKRTFLGPAHAAQRAQLPLVWDITDLSLLAYRRRQGLRRWAPWAHLDGLSFRYPIAISRFIRDELIRQGVLEPIADDEAGYIRQGVDLSRFAVDEPAVADGPAHRLLFVGTLIEDKGAHVVLRALERLVRHEPPGHPGYRLTVCGDSGDEAYKARLRAMVDGSELKDRVIFRGRVTPQEAARMYRSHDVFVFSSIWPEPFATTPLEAMASGCPVVGTPVGGQADFFRHDENCLTYRPESDLELADRLRALADPARRRRLASQALTEVKAKFDVRDYVRRIEDVLLEAAARPNPQTMNTSRLIAGAGTPSQSLGSASQSADPGSR